MLHLALFQLPLLLAQTGMAKTILGWLLVLLCLLLGMLVVLRPTSRRDLTVAELERAARKKG